MSLLCRRTECFYFQVRQRIPEVYLTLVKTLLYKTYPSVIGVSLCYLINHPICRLEEQTTPVAKLSSSSPASLLTGSLVRLDVKQLSNVWTSASSLVTLFTDDSL